MTDAGEPATRRGVVFANPSAGSGSTTPDELQDVFRVDGLEVEVRPCEPSELAERLGQLLDGSDGDHLEFVGVAGGDGSIRCAVGVVLASKSECPLLVVPAGTRNHFAHDIGVHDFDAALEAAIGGHVSHVDVGSVNDAWFINNSSIGIYPWLVEQREAREHRMSKRRAAIVAAWHQLRSGRKLRVRVDGQPEKAWLVFVGNDCYGESLTELTGRDRLDGGVLDLRIARAEGKLSRLRIVGSVLFGRLSRSPLIDRRETASVVLDTGASVEVALDGEVVTMDSPLEYRSRPSQLAVLVPPPKPDD